MAAVENPEVSYSAYSDGTGSSQPIVGGSAPSGGSGSRTDVLAVVKSPVFVLHSLEWIFSIVVMATASSTVARLVSGSGFAIFVAAFAFLAATTFLTLLFLGRRVGALVDYQQLATFVFGALWTLLYFIAGIVMAAGSFKSTESNTAAAFSFLSVPLWGVTAFYGFRANTIPLPFISKFTNRGASSVPQQTVSV